MTPPLSCRPFSTHFLEGTKPLLHPPAADARLSPTAGQYRQWLALASPLEPLQGPLLVPTPGECTVRHPPGGVNTPLPLHCVQAQPTRCRNRGAPPHPATAKTTTVCCVPHGCLPPCPSAAEGPVLTGISVFPRESLRRGPEHQLPRDAQLPGELIPQRPAPGAPSLLFLPHGGHRATNAPALVLGPAPPQNPAEKPLPPAAPMQGDRRPRSVQPPPWTHGAACCPHCDSGHFSTSEPHAATLAACTPSPQPEGQGLPTWDWEAGR